MDRAVKLAREFTARLKSLAGASTADLVGITPGDAFSADELGDLGRTFGPVRGVVVLAQRIVDPVQTIRFHSAGSYSESEIACAYYDAMLRDACWRAVETLREAGYKAAIPRNLRYGAADLRHHISYKKAAVLAGFGAIGRSNLLIHPQWGPWLMLRTVVTDAPLFSDAPVDFSPCGVCRLCIEACPSGALSDAGFERDKCERFYADAGPLRISPYGQINCEECMRACPVGPAPSRLAFERERP
jgi:epoxyqueuosine reductase QueG